jgi:predicted metal-dependent phosphoesterase TrpH
MLFDHHIHSKYSESDSVSEIDDIIHAAIELGLDGIAISDHNAIEGSLLASKKSSGKLIILPSTEISSIEGHIVGLGVRKGIEKYLHAEETVELIHKQGGLAIAAHPYDSFRSGVGDLCWKLPFDAIEINGHCLHGNGKAEKAARLHKKPLVGGSDAHVVEGIGAICTELEAEGPKDILDSIREGKCMPVLNKSGVALKASILRQKIARRYSV